MESALYSMIVLNMRYVAIICSPHCPDPPLKVQHVAMQVFHHGDSTRVTLMFDIWHPEITDIEKRVVTHIATRAIADSEYDNFLSRCM
jgi:hypothetical protein